jgi:hypothetical protein
VTSSSTDPFRYHDGAYVLGALDQADRAAFEAHLETCADCRARVAEARPATELLAGLTLLDIADPTPVPETLLPGLLRAAQRERSNRRWLTGALGALAAACITALVVVLWPTGSGESGPALRAFSVVQTSPVTASARLVPRGWGTEIDLHCHYTQQVERYVPYNLVVIDKRGASHVAGSWKLAPGRETTFTGGTSLRKADISRIEITLADGTPILRLTL